MAVFMKKFLNSVGLGKDEKRLSNFQRAKLLHEFRTFYDVNKDGRLEWSDFKLVIEHICEKSGWKEGSPKNEHCKRLLIEIWRELQDSADDDIDGSISESEWLDLWTRIIINKHPNVKRSTTEMNSSVSNEEHRTTGKSLLPDFLPAWFDNYVTYKFNLLDRAGDGIIDEEEFEYTLSSMFDISPQDCRMAFCMMSQNKEKIIDKEYFTVLALQFYLSDSPSDLGNFINGKLQYELK